jgi:mono/diheme cytochrome c family protein
VPRVAVLEALQRFPSGFVALFASAIVGVGLAGCSLKHPVTNPVNGKVLFAQKCGSCHTLAHAGTTGNVGPNLDYAFLQDRADGMSSSSIEGLVSYWIGHPNTQSVMPANLVTGHDAADVAAYVGMVAAAPGHDTGLLAQAGGVSGTSAADGKLVFQNNGCSSCHTLAAAGATGTVGPNLDQRLRSDCASAASMKVRGKTLAECIHAAIVRPYAFIPSGYAAGVMPATFGQTLKPNELTALVNFLSTATK